MSERLYPSIPDATDFDLDDEPRATFEWATFKAGQKGNDRLVAAEELLRMCVIAVHYARRLAEIKTAVMPILGSFNATADGGRLIGLVSVDAAIKALELVAPDQRKDAK